MGAGQDAHAAEGGAQQRVHVPILRDLVQHDPVRVHGAQEHIDRLMLPRPGEHVRHASKVKPRHTAVTCRQLEALVRHTDPLSHAVADRADQLPQQSGFPAAGRPRDQRGHRKPPQKRTGLRPAAPVLTRNKQIDRAQLPQGADASLAAYRLPAQAEPVAAGQRQKALP